MSLNAHAIDHQLSDSFHADATISAACQGILTTKITPTNTPWYATLNQELDDLKGVAQQWDKEEVNQLKNTVLPAIIECGLAFTQSENHLLDLFNQAEADPIKQKQALTTGLQALNKPANAIVTAISHYESSLKSWGNRLRQAHDKLNASVGKIQSKEQSLASRIQSVNKTIVDLQNQIVKDKTLIKKAQKAAKKSNVVKTIFGIILGAATGGVGAILAGMGVSSIGDAEKKVRALERSIEKYQLELYKHHNDLTHEQQELIALKGLTLSASVALSDVTVAEQSLDTVRTQWDQFHQELTGVIGKIENATDAQRIIVEKAWFNAACKEWALVIKDAQDTASLAA